MTLNNVTRLFLILALSLPTLHSMDSCRFVSSDVTEVSTREVVMMRSANERQEIEANRNAAATDGDEGYWNIKTPTLGGMQFWTDVAFFHEWRIQQNVLTEHHRLLSGSNIRHAWGSLEACQTALNRIRREQTFPEMKGEAVILLHGLARTRQSMGSLERYLEKETDFQVFRFSYASTRASIASHATNLKRVIDSMRGFDKIHIVGHSMGNIVLRHYLSDVTDPESGKQGDGRLGRIVMLAPPNQGSQLARMLRFSGVFPVVAGESGAALGHRWKELKPRLATPQTEFGIIAGRAG